MRNWLCVIGLHRGEYVYMDIWRLVSIYRCTRPGCEHAWAKNIRP